MRAWLLGLGLFVGGAAAAVACGGDDSNTGGGGSGTTGDMGGGTTVGSGGGTAGGGTGGTTTTTTTQGTGGGGGVFVPMCIDDNDTIFAVDHLNFGDATANAWKSVGFDIDGINSQGTCNNHCKIASGAMANKVCQDGNLGIDNSFGENILPFVENVQANFSQTINDGITNGTFTLMIDLLGLTTDPDQGPIVARVYGGGDLTHHPAFDGTDCWPVTPESLSNKTDITKSKATFNMSQVAANHYTSGVVPTMPLVVNSNAGPILLNLQQARVEFDLDATHTTVTNGLIGGVLDRDEFRATLEKVAGQMGPIFCAFVDDPVNNAADIMDDGTQPANTMTPCNGISIGLGFTMKRVKLGGIGPAAQMMPNPCQ